MVRLYLWHFSGPHYNRLLSAVGPVAAQAAAEAAVTHTGEAVCMLLMPLLMLIP